MKKFLVAVGAVVALAIPTVGIAATLHTPQSGTDCKSGESLVRWHFVNNQTGGATSGTLTAYFETGGTDTNMGAPGDITLTDNTPDVHGPTLHFNVYTTGYASLVSANTGSVPGRLVLSDWCKK